MQSPTKSVDAAALLMGRNGDFGFGWRSFGAVFDSGHCICSPSAQGTVALEAGGKNPQPGNLFLFGFVFVLCE